MEREGKKGYKFQSNIAGGPFKKKFWGLQVMNFTLNKKINLFFNYFRFKFGVKPAPFFLVFCDILP